jgi:hypothetical protein
MDRSDIRCSEGRAKNRAFSVYVSRGRTGAKRKQGEMILSPPAIIR